MNGERRAGRLGVVENWSGGRQRVEGRGWKAEGGRQRVEGRGWKAEGGETLRL
jgi:hypothetical protein